MTSLKTLLLASLLPVAAQAAPVDVLFVGNSYTFGRIAPVLNYNAANVTDLTAPERGGSFADTTGAHPFEPHPWGGVPGIFKQLTVQAGLDYDVSLSTRPAASLRGHFLNANPADWDLRGNIGLKAWDKVVLQEQSDEVLPRQTNAVGNELRSNPEYTRYFANLIENYVHSPVEMGPIRYRDAFPGADQHEGQAACEAVEGSRVTCSRDRGSYANANANPDAELYLYQTWARPDLLEGAFVTERNDVTGEITRTTDLSEQTHYASLEAMTEDFVTGYQAVVDQADDDGTAGFAGIAPVGEAFLRAVRTGIAVRDFWADDAMTDDMLDLWFDDGTHASVYGSYLSALVMYGTLTGKDPSLFGSTEIAAFDLGIDPQSAMLLQRVAGDQLGFGVQEPAPVPIPPAGPLAAMAFVGLALMGRKRGATP